MLLSFGRVVLRQCFISIEIRSTFKLGLWLELRISIRLAMLICKLTNVPLSSIGSRPVDLCCKQSLQEEIIHPR